MKKNLWREQDFCCKPALTEADHISEAKVHYFPNNFRNIILWLKDQRGREGELSFF